MSLARRRQWGYGQGVHDLVEEHESDEATRTQLKEHLLDLFRAPTYRPPLLPAVALELLALTRQPDVDLPEVVALLGHDPMLAGQVLRVARSAAYSRGEPLRSLEEAVVRLGLSRIADIFLRVSLESKVFRAPGFSEPMAQLRRHSTFTAEAARLVCQRTSGLEDSGYLCGLLHDVGIAACLLALSGPLRGAFDGSFERAWPCIESVHTSCSEMLARLWGLPADVVLVVGQHHIHEPSAPLHPVAAAVAYADCFSAQLGLGFLTETQPEHLPAMARQLGLSGAEQERLTAVLRAIAASLESS